MQSNARLTVFILVERQILNKSSRHLLSLLLADVNSDQINCKIVGFYKFCEVGLLLQFLFQSSYNTLISSTDCFSFAAYFAIRDFPIEWVACSEACKNGFTSEGQRCFCSLCYDHLFLPAFSQYSGCRSLITIKKGYSEKFDKFYGVPNGLYYYC